MKIQMLTGVLYVYILFPFGACRMFVSTAKRLRVLKSSELSATSVSPLSGCLVFTEAGIITLVLLFLCASFVIG